MTTTHIRRWPLAAALVASVVVFGACSTTEPTPEDGTTVADVPSDAGAGRVLPTPTPNDHGMDDPIRVLETVCSTVFTRDAASEESYSDSYKRARAFFTPNLAKDLFKPTKGIRPYPQWVRWQEQKAWITGACTATAAQHPVDTDKAVSRVLSVTETVETADGTTTEQQSWVVYATASKTSDGWRVGQFTVNGN